MDVAACGAAVLSAQQAVRDAFLSRYAPPTAPPPRHAFERRYAMHCRRWHSVSVERLAGPIAANLACAGVRAQLLPRSRQSGTAPTCACQTACRRACVRWRWRDTSAGAQAKARLRTVTIDTCLENHVAFTRCVNQLCTAHGTLHNEQVNFKTCCYELECELE